MLRVTRLSRDNFRDGEKHWAVMQVRSSESTALGGRPDMLKRILPLVHNLVPASHKCLLLAIRIVTQITMIAKFVSPTCHLLDHGRRLIQQLAELFLVGY